MDVFLDTKYVALTVSNGLLKCKIKETEEHQTFTKDQVKRIFIHRSCTISGEALFFCASNGIDVNLLTKSGEVKGQLLGLKQTHNAKIQEQQKQFVSSSKALQWIIQLLNFKIRQQQALLTAFHHKVDTQETPVDLEKTALRFERQIGSIAQCRGLNLATASPKLRGYEGSVSARYWGAIKSILPKALGFEKRSGQFAQDAVNASLNYGYGMLYGYMRSAIFKAGLTPYWGVLHEGGPQQEALVYDLVEPFRVWVDFVVIELFAESILDIDCFEPYKNGIGLNQNGKRILVQAIKIHFSEIVALGELERNRETHIERYPYQMIKHF